MKTLPFRLTLAATLVAAATLPAAVHAQQSASCVRLMTLVDEAGDRLTDEFGDAREVAETDDPNRCSVYVARVVTAGGLIGNADAATAVETVETTEETTETVQVEQEATIEGEVQVTLPDPEVRVEQDPAEIAVRTTPPEVNISQGQPVIEIRQAQPIITVQMTQPTITVEQPAPEIIVTMPEPGVDVATAQPVIEVNIPEPRVTVTQGQPRLAVDLDTNVGATAETNTALDRSDDEVGNMVVTANGLSDAAGEPMIEYVDSEEPPVVNVEGTEPQVNYVAAEADVRIESDGEPVIEMLDGGEPKILIRRAGEEDGAALDAEQPAAVAALAPDADVDAVTPATTAETETAEIEQRDPRDAFARGDDATLDTADEGVMTVGDLAGMDVRNARGEELGEVDRVVRNGNDTYVVVAHGGWFFGLNDKEIALPVGDVTIRGDEVVLRGLTEAQIEAMPDYDYANEVSLEGSDEVTLRRLN